VSLACPAQGKRPPATLSLKLDSMEQCYHQDRAGFERAVADLVGCYAYSLGFRDGEGLRGLKPACGMDRLPIMSDCPPFSGKGPGNGGNSQAHGGRGQNVLFVDGSVRYATSRQVRPGDDIYLNNDRLILAGLHEGDSVLAASDAAP
jgi:prepilin-type processing-associated H-X9-DG protein